MSEREIERMVVRLTGDASGYKAMLKEAQRITRQAQEVISKLGPALTKSVTVPLLAVGTAAIKVSADFEHSMAKMRGLAGQSAEAVAGFREEILKLAPAVGKSPFELAQAMNNIVGAGIDGANALETLRASARASAAGLGDTLTVADAVTSALNAYGPANLGAAQAVDILTAAVREGKAEASTFAPVLGQVLPIANELGVQFSEAAGMIAFLTKSTGSASIAATGLRGILSQMIRPTEDAIKALEEVGLSTDYLRRSIKQNGLHQTLMDLRNVFEKSGVPITRMFADIEGLNAVLQATGPQAKDAAAVIEAVGKSAGATDDAFAAVAKTARQQFNEAFASVQVALVRLGDELSTVLVPMLQKARDFIDRMTEAWQGLTPEQKQAIVQMGLMAAAIGPALLAIKALIAVLGLLKIAIAATGVGAIAIAIGLVVEQTIGWEKVIKGIIELWKGVEETIRGVGILIDEAALKSVARGLGMDPEDLQAILERGKAMKELTRNAQELRQAMQASLGAHKPLETAANIKTQWDESAFDTSGFKIDMSGMNLKPLDDKQREEMLARVREVNKETEAAAKAAAKVQEEHQKAIAETVKTLKEQIATYGMSRKELALYQAAQMGASDSQKAVIAALEDSLVAKEAATKATEDAKRATDEAREAEKRFRDSFRDGAIEGAGRGFDAYARIQESQRLRAAGRDNPLAAPKLISSGGKAVAETMAKDQTQAKQLTVLQSIDSGIGELTKKEPVQIKAAGISGN